MRFLHRSSSRTSSSRLCGGNSQIGFGKLDSVGNRKLRAERRKKSNRSRVIKKISRIIGSGPRRLDDGGGSLKVADVDDKALKDSYVSRCRLDTEAVIRGVSLAAGGFGLPPPRVVESGLKDID